MHNNRPRSDKLLSQARERLAYSLLGSRMNYNQLRHLSEIADDLALFLDQFIIYARQIGREAFRIRYGIDRQFMTIREMGIHFRRSQGVIQRRLQRAEYEIFVEIRRQNDLVDSLLAPYPYYE